METESGRRDWRATLASPLHPGKGVQLRRQGPKAIIGGERKMSHLQAVKARNDHKQRKYSCKWSRVYGEGFVNSSLLD